MWERIVSYYVVFLFLSESISRNGVFLRKWRQCRTDRGFGWKHRQYRLCRCFSFFLCLLLQFLEDLSDRELERFICENAAARWFCQFDLTAKTPDHSVFVRVRSRIGTSKLSKIFSLLRNQLKAQGYMSEVFTFVDATTRNFYFLLSELQTLRLLSSYF